MIGTMKNNSVLYTPRQVATFYSIRKDTLLYYDRIGLFQPEIRKENGYRYYSASQLAELDTILTLRDLDFPIPAIKEALKDLNPGSFVELMEREEESIRRKIDAYEHEGRPEDPQGCVRRLEGGEGQTVHLPGEPDVHPP